LLAGKRMGALVWDGPRPVGGRFREIVFSSGQGL